MAHTYPSPLAGYEKAPPLPNEISEDGKSYVNPQTGVLSTSYERFADPLDNGRRGAFAEKLGGGNADPVVQSDVHIYYFQNSAAQKKFAHELWERIRREFPELRIYKLWDQPIGPHPIAMFEVDILTPAQFGAFIPWLVVNRGPLSALVHPNTINPVTGEHDQERRDHTERATWIGEKVILDASILRDDKS